MSSGIVMLSPGDVTKLVNLITQLITLDQNQATEIADAQAQVNVLTNEVQGFQDPTLNSSVQAAITAATNALPPAATPPASTPPASTPPSDSTPPASTPPTDSTPAAPANTPPTGS